MRYLPEDDYEKKEIEELHAEPWQLKLLELNPEYSSWGPHEDYMYVKGDGWNSPLLFESWKHFTQGDPTKVFSFPFRLYDLNEVVNFYFNVSRSIADCHICRGTGYHPDAQWVVLSFNRHSSPFHVITADEEITKQSYMEHLGLSDDDERILLPCGSYPDEDTFNRYGKEFREFCEKMKVQEFWGNDITMDEFEALCSVQDCRIKEKPTPELLKIVNATSHSVNSGYYHNLDHRHILASQRCKRLGLPFDCPECGGKGRIYTESAAQVTLVLWVIHPRKGASRGVEIKNIQKGDLPGIFDILNEAACRNYQRFRKVLQSAPEDFDSIEQKM